MLVVAFTKDFEDDEYFVTNMTEEELDEMHFGVDSDPITYAESIGRKMEYIGSSNAPFCELLWNMGIAYAEKDFGDVIDD